MIPNRQFPVHAPSDNPGNRSCPVASGSPRVLVVEDDQFVRSVLMAQLRRDGIAAKAVVNGDEAVTVYAAPGQFDVVLLDMVMPGTAQGYDVARHIRSLDPSVRIILLSGYTGALELGNNLDIDATLAKPFAKADLMAQVHAGIIGGAG